MDTIEYATFRYDTVEVENGLKYCFMNNQAGLINMERKNTLCFV